MKQKKYDIAGNPPAELVKICLLQKDSVENLKAIVLTTYIAKGQSNVLIIDKIKKKKLLLELLLSNHALAKIATAINPQGSFVR